MQVFNKKINQEYLAKSIFFIITSSIFFDYLYSFDFSSGGASKDFFSTFGAVQDLKNYNLKNWSNYTKHFPLHYFLLSLIYRVTEFKDNIRLIYIFISLVQPILVFLILSRIYDKLNKNILLIFSSFIYLLPFLRSSVVWANAHSTALTFFLLATLFLIIFFENKKFYAMFLSIFFLSCAVYAVQYFAAFFLIFLLKIYLAFNFLTLLKYFIICIIFSFPGLYFLYYIPITSALGLSENPFNVLLINLSIIFFYLLFFINKESINSLFKQINIEQIFIFIIFSILIVSISAFNFDYEFFVGGGIFYKFSLLFFKSKFIFYASSFLGLLFILLIFRSYFINGDYKNIFVLLSILSCFLAISWSYMIFQKYYEPTLILSLLFFLNRSIFKVIFKNYKNLFILFSITFVYLFFTLLYINIDLKLI